ncbi:SulP family inorganic anion transporter [Paenibacillus crassostreae]|uniref:Sulfate transporter n=1 Tax=Paenibacillus crassostreae TaxID=1763538 RepID=A0A167FKT2_9BACL|nr:sulfate permease [Paenibacillus crassostreae]AOZ94298.1 sodium-independent anion transporter [Paenibacillus crassostreae]OAB76664.1 sulfate transporter [Paenibacillus crassostreae]
MKVSFRGRYLGYSRQSFQKDTISGLIVGIVAIPLGMAFAIASGVKPEYGLYTTIIAGILISLLGGSKFQIGGPTGAFIPIIFAIVMQYGYENLLIAGFMAGILLFLMGLFKLGAVIKFIPRPVTIGFTTGIAVTIFGGQLSNFFGLENLEKHEYFFSNMKEVVMHLGATNSYSILVAAICLTTIYITPKLFPRIPSSLAGLLLSTVVAALLFPDKVATIGSTYGAISNSLPNFHFPDFTLDKIQNLIQPAFVIAMLGGIESLLSAVVADGMTGTRHHSNRELMGQGVANMITPLFGGIPATGAIARTATNIKNGAVSPISGVIHGIVVLLVLVLFAPYASRIPLASMAPILMVVAWNMSERHEFAHIVKSKSLETLVLLTTFLLTVFKDLTIAVEIGLVCSAIVFIKHMSQHLKMSKVLPDNFAKNDQVVAHTVNDEHNCPYISIYELEGPLFFGVADQFEKSIMDEIAHGPKVLILKMNNVPYIDTTGEANFTTVMKYFIKQGGTVLITEIQNQPLQVLQNIHLDEVIGKENFFDQTGEAISHSFTKLHKSQCLGCQHDAFRECQMRSNPTVKAVDHQVLEPTLVK